MWGTNRNTLSRKGESGGCSVRAHDTCGRFKNPPLFFSVEEESIFVAVPGRGGDQNATCGVKDTWTPCAERAKVGGWLVGHTRVGRGQTQETCLLHGNRTRRNDWGTTVAMVENQAKMEQAVCVSRKGEARKGCRQTGKPIPSPMGRLQSFRKGTRGTQGEKGMVTKRVQTNLTREGRGYR